MPATEARRTAILDGLLVCTAIPILYLVAMPVSGLAGRTMVNLVPGAEMASMVETGTEGDTARVQALGNLVLIFPITALLPLRVPRMRSWRALIMAIVSVSVLIEAAQWLLAVGRATTADDAILNSVGGLLGAAATWYWWRSRRDRERLPPRRTSRTRLRSQTRS
ncbi:VanZ family protein [Actinokineospora auranticolor]|uniref:VanZ family protein n=1 Tax=Actinokineospora auranticolor TaxID=155976 RepID=UPI000CEBC82D